MTGVEWPAGWPRTPRHDREANNQFEVSLAQAFDDLEETLRKLGVEQYRYSFDAEARQRDGRPYSRANPDDPSFVLRFVLDGEQKGIAVDAYTRLRDNVRSLALHLEDKRKMDPRPVTTGESEFSNLRLPSGDEVGERAAHEVLNLPPNPSDNAVTNAYREKVKEVHPDLGGTAEAFSAVKRARNELLDDHAEVDTA